MDAQSEKLEVFNKKLENIKNDQTEMKNTITEMKNTLEGINSRLNDSEKDIYKYIISTIFQPQCHLNTADVL